MDGLLPAPTALFQYASVGDFNSVTRCVSRGDNINYVNSIGHLVLCVFSFSFTRFVCANVNIPYFL